MIHGRKGAEPLHTELAILVFPFRPGQHRFHLRLFGQAFAIIHGRKGAEPLHTELAILVFPFRPGQHRFHLRLFGQAFAIIHGRKGAERIQPCKVLKLGILPPCKIPKVLFLLKHTGQATCILYGGGKGAEEHRGLGTECGQFFPAHLGQQLIQ